MKGMTVIVKTIASWVKVLIILFGIYIILFGYWFLKERPYLPAKGQRRRLVGRWKGVQVYGAAECSREAVLVLHGL